MSAWAIDELVVHGKPPPPRRSWTVIAGASLSIVLHGILLLFLMLPARPGAPRPSLQGTTESVAWFDILPAKQVPQNAPEPKPAPAPSANRVAPATLAPPVLAIDTLSESAIRSDAAPAVPPLPGPARADTTNPASSAADTSAAPASEPGYVWHVLDHLQDFQSYPRAAQRRGHEGTVLIRARVSRKGQVLKAEVRESSGHRSLDEAALALLAAASPLPPPPRGTTAITDLDLPIAYSLRPQ